MTATVKELIKLLSHYKEDTKVFIDGENCNLPINWVGMGEMEKENNDGTYDVVLIGN